MFVGDVDGTPELAVCRLAAAPGLAGRPVVFMPGNHEFYGDRWRSASPPKAACTGTDVHLLDRGSIALAGVRFVGATLCTDYALFGDAAKAMAACRLLNDID